MDTYDRSVILQQTFDQSVTLKHPGKILTRILGKECFVDDVPTIHKTYDMKQSELRMIIWEHLVPL